MKILLFLNNDVHSATALNLLFQNLLNHQVKIILSKKVGNIDNLPSELLEMKKFEQDKMERLFDELDSTNEQTNKFKSFKQIANFFGTKISNYENVNSEIALQDFRKFAPDLIISIRFGQIFKQALIDIPRRGVINLHSGILPNYRGVLASFWAILNGEKEIGATLHYISDSRIDDGDVIGFSKIKIDWDSSLVFNINRIYETACQLLSQVIEKISNGAKPEVIKQSELGSGSYFSYPKTDDIKKFVKLMPLTKPEDMDKILQNW
jgi:methionyl-tRNA formyltransferase